jgi:two-component system, NarL family, sensor kinase
VHGFGERSGIRTEVHIESGFARLPQQVETALFRIVQESLANIQRHSGSATALVRLRAEGPGVCLEIADQGSGLLHHPAASTPSKQLRLGVGIPGMRERMTQLGGILEIQSNSSGTLVRATLSISSGQGQEAENATASHSHR